MFTTLRAGTKPCSLRATPIISIVTSCRLFTAKQIGLELLRMKLAGTRHLAAVREIYAVIFARQADPTVATALQTPADEAPKALVNAEAGAADGSPTVERELLESSLRRCRSSQGAAENVIAADAHDDVENTGVGINGAQSLQAKLERREPHDVAMRMHDSGSMIDQEVERIFGALLTAKSNGVSMDRLVCRVVIEARDGWILPLSGVEGESVFQVSLPVRNFGSAQ
jgi:hypothetical protein